MPWRRPVVAMAMLTALLVAPSSLSAAPPNGLLNPSVAPWAGTVSTPFAFAVRYRAPVSNPAETVKATVAGQTVWLSLTAGSMHDGAWGATRLLPAGTWNVTFEASAAKGAPPSVSAGPVTVASQATPKPPPPSGSRPPVVVDEPVAPAPPTPAPDPAHSAAPSPAEAPAGRGSVAPSTPRPAAAPASQEPAATARVRPGRSPRRSGVAGASTSPDAAGPVGGSEVPPAGRQPAVGDGQLLDLVLLLGLAGVAAIATLGVAWIILAGRRDRSAATVLGPGTQDPAISAIPTVEQRAVRRARLRSSDDPILAALGLSDERPVDVPGASPDPQRSSRRRGGAPR